ncbi:hinge connector of long tail fiber protein distal connector [Acinetobacter phage vB_AbaM_Berthold]|uniref:Hinge connector of long tail fiber, distal connector n=2 Tax=Lazarusvirus TaxID=2842820 RepID=A0A6B9J510_9CAUD|nr:hinge connector of long tail fiber protein distal connector [Acinetobacter phage vB_AbaM_Berthold]YP_009887011.1 hinge connector of long tail fiber protein distal connector [Acinetobacter phage vB_AbaM_Lazarus]QGZ15582.1 hinge connector of long tail fiber, distal connector [Acinetobacter phage vB_AbaM_Berthold]QHJ74174.1 hinge connector of long tail fiber, distal connector [Acinetobacter phage vB_AbaM_Lazarus]
MADLKAGTTIGGTLVWTQGNFPLFPTGDTLLYKTYKVYSEKDKPQAIDNDFVSKAQGGTYNSTVVFNKNIVLRAAGGTSGNLTSINLYGDLGDGAMPTYGFYVGSTVDASNGKHGSVVGNWAVYNVATNGGWIFRTQTKNVASINTEGTGSFNAVNVDMQPTVDSHVTRKDYVDRLINTVTDNANSKVSKTNPNGDTMVGPLTAPNFISTKVATAPAQVPQLGQVVQRGVILDYGTF